MADLFPSLFSSITRKLLRKFREEGSELRFVGGAVRDCLAKEAPKDIDFCTPAPPEAVIRWVHEVGFRISLAGLSHGTVSAHTSSGQTFEITTLRRDVHPDGRHAAVEFSTSWEEDASRRDFTINALYCDDTGQVYDYFGGLQDLEEGRVRFIGDPLKRIEEDHLRILRYFRFWARMGRALPEPELLRILEEQASTLKRISGERILQELISLFSLPRFAEAISLMKRVLKTALGVDFLPLQDIPCWDHQLLQDPLVRFSLGLPSDDAFAAVKNRLPLSRAQESALALYEERALYDVTNPEKRLRRALSFQQQGTYRYRLSIDAAYAVLQGDLRASDLYGILDGIERGIYPEFPLKGKDLLKSGASSGQILGKALAETRRWWEDCLGRPPKAECLTAALRAYEHLSRQTR